MPLKYLVLFVAVLILGFPSRGSDFYWMLIKNEREWKVSETRTFLDGKLPFHVIKQLDSIYASYPSEYVFYNQGQELNAFIGCTFDLYSIDDSAILNQYQYNNRGYTCYSSPFVRDSKNYLIGGYGFWHYHLDLLEFDNIKGGWELIQTINQPDNFYSDGIYQTSEGIYALFGYFNNEREVGSKVQAGSYFLEWETKEWKPVDVHIEGVEDVELNYYNSIDGVVEMKDYFYINFSVLSPNIGWNIIEKETGIIYVNELRWSDLSFHTPYVEVIDNRVNFLTSSGVPYSLDFDSLVSQSREVGWVKVQENSTLSILPGRDLVYVSIITLLSFGLLFLFIKRKGNEDTSNGVEETAAIVQSLMRHAGQLLESEKLDELLEIHTLTNPDSRRLKRSRLINRINQYYQSQKGKALIFRDKNPEDKRYIYYRIEP